MYFQTTTMKYSRERPRDFVTFKYKEVRIDKFKKAYQNNFKENINCDVLASEQGPSCSRIDQHPSLKIIQISFPNDLSKSGFFQKYLLFQEHQIFRAFQVSIPKPSVLFQSRSRNVLHLFPQEVYQQPICQDQLHSKTSCRKKIRTILRLWLKVLTLLRGDTHLTSTLQAGWRSKAKMRCYRTQGWGSSKCSERPIFILFFLVKKI